MVFDDVIRRARLDVVRGGLLVEAPRDDDHRDAGGVALGDPQGVGGAERRERMVRDDQVGDELPQGAGEIGCRVDKAGGARDPGATQLEFYELSVARDVLDDQDARRRGGRTLGGHVSEAERDCGGAC